MNENYIALYSTMCQNKGRLRIIFSKMINNRLFMYIWNRFVIMISITPYNIHFKSISGRDSYQGIHTDKNWTFGRRSVLQGILFHELLKAYDIPSNISGDVASHEKSFRGKIQPCPAAQWRNPVISLSCLVWLG